MTKKKHYLKENWNEHTLEALLNKKVFPMIIGQDSYLIVTCNNLHKKVLKEFEVEDLRIMIGQNIGLKFLIPLAIKELKKDMFSEGHFYEGDLLKSVLTSEKNYWKTDNASWETICELFENNKEKVESFDTTEKIRSGLKNAFTEFRRINE